MERAEGRYVVELPFLIAEERLDAIVALVARELEVPEARLRKLLSRRIGPVTKPVERGQAERVGRALRRAGVPAVIAPADHARVATLSSGEWLADPVLPRAEAVPAPGGGDPALEPLEGESAQEPAVGVTEDDWGEDEGFRDELPETDWIAEFGGDPFSPPRPPWWRLLLGSALVVGVLVLIALQVLWVAPG